MKAEPPPKISAITTMNAADWWLAIQTPMIAATEATKTSPRRHIVTVIRTVKPRSGAYLVRVAMTHLRIPPGQQPGTLCPGLPGTQLAIYLNNAKRRLKPSAQQAESRCRDCAHGEFRRGRSLYAGQVPQAAGGDRLDNCGGSPRDGRASPRGWFRRRAACAPRPRWRQRTAGCSPPSRTPPALPAPLPP